VLLVQRAKLAETWMRANDPCEGGKAVRRSVPQSKVDRFGHVGRCFVEGDEESERAMLDELVHQWRTPQCSIEGIDEVRPGVWMPRKQSLPKQATLVPPVWLGWGQTPDKHECIIGPAWRADVAAELARNSKAVRVRDCFDVEVPDETSRLPSHRRQTLYPTAKRLFDIVVSVLVLIGSAPLMLLIAAAIVIESGFPVFFAHKRQTRGGKQFSCLKFRTMYQNAEQMVEQLRERNQCDGPQVYIKDDPRITRVGRILRKFTLDELPQFWNVLVGEMSIVGPRPSPDEENRYCPAWREMRLSVRPGITGLWQLRRTRLPGRDFYEWIRYDIEYVRQASFWLDLTICVQTIRIILFGREHQ
jgi:lipopolysaccharide/colanic/teichoic acid biosynthesis glycosyltransferase